MPLPLIFIAIAIIAGGAATTVAVLWDHIISKLKGKKVAVLGARAVGKTHLIKFLTTGSIPEEYKQTVAPEKSKSKRLQLKELDLKIKNSLDVSGDKSAYADWKELVEAADFVFYLLRADRLIAGDKNVENRARDDLRHIGAWLDKIEQGENIRPSLFIIGTHCDLDSEFANLTQETIGGYADKFMRLPIVSELVMHGGGMKHTKVVLGSMKTISATEALVHQIFSQVAT